ncbi:MAG TPA: NlpC/P60 family protein [Trebonia sp.]|nr:NlpC/P60 family protein [Trebonia sp.]
MSRPRWAPDPAHGIIDKERDWHVRRLRARGAGESGDSGIGFRRRTARRAVIGATAAVALAVGGGAYYAQSARAAYQLSIPQAQAQVNSLQGQIDQTGQQYIQLNQQVSSANVRLKSVQKQYAQAQAQFTAARARLRKVAVASFETANQSSIAALLTNGDPSQVLTQASMLEELGTDDSAQANAFLATAQTVSAALANVQRTVDGIAQLQSQAKAKKDHLNTLLAGANTTLGTLNLQQQAQVAASLIGGDTAYVTDATYTGPLTTAADKAVAFAYSKLGTWYLWGGTGPQYDCSGLVQAAWASAGVSIPRTTYAQFDALPHVSKAELQPGDLVFFEGLGHVGMYVGGGLMIDAPRTGEQVRLLALDSSWYAANYVGAARP